MSHPFFDPSLTWQHFCYPYDENLVSTISSVSHLPSQFQPTQSLNMPRTKQSAARRPTLVSQDDGERSVDDWGKLKLFALRLKCNQYSLSETGNKMELQERLFDHFHPDQDSRISESFSATATYEQEFDLQRVLDQNDDDLMSAEDEHVDDQQENIDDGVQHDGTIQQDNITNPVDDLGTTDALQQEIRALRSQIASMKRAAPPPSATTVVNKRRRRKTKLSSSQHGASSNQIVSASSTPQQQQNSQYVVNDTANGSLHFQSNHNYQSNNNVNPTSTSTICSSGGSYGAAVSAPQQQHQHQQVSQTTPQVQQVSQTTPQVQQVYQQYPSQHAPPALMSINTSYGANNNNNASYNINDYNGSYQYVPATGYNQGNSYSYTQSPNLYPQSQPSNASYVNPFTPPAAPARLLKKIQRREFVDLAELLPNNAVSDSDSTGQPHIQISKHTKTLQLSHGISKREKLGSYPKWSLAWHIFMQAHLYYHPHDFHNLFTYHKNLCNHINKYSIEACVKYDREFRLTMASEKGLPQEHRTLTWLDSVNQGLFLKHLAGTQVSTCNYCFARGHYEANCPEKREAEARDPKNLPSQIATAVQQSLCDFRKSSNTTNNNNNNTTTIPSVPPKEKFCFRFNQGVPCKQPPCQFGHFCSFCKTLSHPFSQCRRKSAGANFVVPHGGKH